MHGFGFQQNFQGHGIPQPMNFSPPPPQPGFLPNRQDSSNLAGVPMMQPFNNFHGSPYYLPQSSYPRPMMNQSHQFVPQPFHGNPFGAIGSFQQPQDVAYPMAPFLHPANSGIGYDRGSLVPGMNPFAYQPALMGANRPSAPHFINPSADESSGRLEEGNGGPSTKPLNRKFKLLNQTKDATVALPKFPKFEGFNILNKKEIHTDLVVIQKSLEDVDSDSSTCSFESDEILTSTYPVKPRRWSLRPHTNRNVSRTSSVESAVPYDVIDASAAEDAFADLSRISRSNPELAHSEILRENYENQCKALADSVAKSQSRHSMEQCAHTNYLKLLQLGLSAQIRRLALLRKRKLFVAEIVSALQCNQNGALHLATSATTLQEKRLSRPLTVNEGGNKTKKTAHKKSKSSNEGPPNIVGHTGCNTLVTTIRVNSFEDSSTTVDFKLGVGDQLETPFGPGIVEAINCETRTLKIAISFGTLHATVDSALRWKVQEYEQSEECLPLSSCQPSPVLSRWMSSASNHGFEGSHRSRPRDSNFLRSYVCSKDVGKQDILAAVFPSEILLTDKYEQLVHRHHEEKYGDVFDVYKSMDTENELSCRINGLVTKIADLNECVCKEQALATALVDECVQFNLRAAQTRLIDFTHRVLRNNSYFAEEASSTGTNNIDNVSGPERGKRKVLQLEGVAVDSAETASVGRLRSRYGNRDDEIEVSVSQKKSRR